MSRGRILIVEDSEDGALLLSEIFKREGFEAVVTGSAAGGLRSAEEAQPTAIFIDWELPDGSGLDVCRRIRTRDDAVPILMVTGRADEASAARALDAGADDFVVKPVRPTELVARLEATLRRVASHSRGARAPAPEPQPEPAAGPGLRFGQVTVDLKARLASVDGVPVALGALEFGLLEYLARNRSVAVSKEQILAEVYGYAADLDTGRVDLLVRRLRSKLGRGAGQGDQIVAVPGYGFRLDPLD